VNGSAGPVFITVTATLPVAGGPALSASVDLEADVAGSVEVPVASALLNAASFALDSPVAPGSLVSLFGSNLANAALAAESLPLGTSLGDTTVQLGDAPLPLAYASSGQINAQIPRGVPLNSELELTVTRGAALSLPQPVITAVAAPGVFTRDQSGAGPGLIVNGADNSLNDAEHPAHAGDTIVIYGTGLGAVTPLPPDGGGADSAAGTDNSATLTIGGRPAQVTYSGLTPGFPGLYQVNAVIAAGTPSGDGLSVVLTVARQVSRPVTISVR
jgi:uncharacterized protein (TIGR03437 family)